ncbi:hypothetical protein CYPRO_1575 [Cyclonatronum proteinivorum]|uniref:Uncharacterized protein n=1 Tax=Cyclonatronum proteinivorum TaxID=1457365 RepID=A0A345UK24_9BACT|nr:hypothetical protein [Cyclonatronum proteinivorum]AXJ00826.1 hypothetical protein CYPRO_1575 [Cyclonatronum proteinivorum]
MNPSGEPTGDLQFWSTAQLLALGTLQRLQYNRSRYEAEAADTAEALGPEARHEALCAQLESICLDLQRYRNLYQACDDSGDERLVSGLFLLFQRLHNSWHRFHHELLELPASRISGYIPETDRQRALWNPDVFEDSPFEDTALPPSLPDSRSVSEALQRTEQLRIRFRRSG